MIDWSAGWFGSLFRIFSSALVLALATGLVILLSALDQRIAASDLIVTPYPARTNVRKRRVLMPTLRRE